MQVITIIALNSPNNHSSRGDQSRWFHCGNCNGLFQLAEPLQVSDKCPLCGGDPYSTKSGQLGASIAQQVNAVNVVADVSGGVKTSWTMPKLVGVWLGLLLFIVLGARWKWKRPAIAATEKKAPSGEVISAKDQVFLQKVMPACLDAYVGFLASTTNESRSQFVLDPISSMVRMSRYYELNAVPKFNLDAMRVENHHLIQLPQGPAVEVQWIPGEHSCVETVFREENGEWRLDWPHYSRYGDHPWALFLAGDGPSEGEFRVYARERLAEELKTKDTISLVLYAPVAGRLGELSGRSPECVVKRDSLDGKKITQALQERKQGRRPFGVRLPNLDPDEVIRLRVRMKRNEIGAQRGFEIMEVKACHWYSVPDVLEPSLK